MQTLQSLIAGKCCHLPHLPIFECCCRIRPAGASPAPEELGACSSCPSTVLLGRSPLVAACSCAPRAAAAPAPMPAPRACDAARRSSGAAGDVWLELRPPDASRHLTLWSARRAACTIAHAQLWNIEDSNAKALLGCIQGSMSSSSSGAQLRSMSSPTFGWASRQRRSAAAAAASTSGSSGARCCPSCASGARRPSASTCNGKSHACGCTGHVATGPRSRLSYIPMPLQQWQCTGEPGIRRIEE